MLSKKFFFLACLVCLISTVSFGQVTTGGSYDPADSSVIPAKRMPQHTEFLNGTNNFPAKPRNQWELGLKFGAMQIAGDIPSTFFTLPNFGVHIRKAFGYVFSMRLEYVYGEPKGLDWRGRIATAQNTPYADAGQAGQVVYTAYRSRVQDLSLQGVVTLNNIRFHKSKTGMNLYLFGGVGGTIYDTRINARNGNFTPYNYGGINGGVYENRKDTRDQLKDLMDDTYETRAENHGETRPKLFQDTFKPSGTIGMGMAFKLSNRFNLALEDRWTVVKDDLLDGTRWEDAGDLTRDYDSYNFLSLGINYNLGAKSVEPLYWLNPLDYAYSEIRNPRLMRLPKPVLPDADGDGVTDQFDMEQTPAGAPVDSHGVSRDTDGDGVPDYKDKELVTPTACQPVDADGVGKCPCPNEECFALYTKKGNCAEELGGLPSVSFKSNSNSLSDDAKAVLSTVAAKIRNTPNCKVVVIGYGTSNKKEQQLSWDHVNTVINYLVEKEGVASDRLIFQYGQDGPNDTVDLRGADSTEDGPNQVAPPHPNLRKK